MLLTQSIDEWDTCLHAVVWWDLHVGFDICVGFPEEGCIDHRLLTVPALLGSALLEVVNLSPVQPPQH